MSLLEQSLDFKVPHCQSQEINIKTERWEHETKTRKSQSDYAEFKEGHIQADLSKDWASKTEEINRSINSGETNAIAKQEDWGGKYIKDITGSEN